MKRWVVGVLIAVAAVVVLWELFVVAVGIITSHMWFESVDDGSVYTTMLTAKVLLFCVFGAIAGLVGGLTLLAVHRTRPRIEVDPHGAPFRAWFRQHESRLWRVTLLLAVVIPGVLVGKRAAGQWQTYLLWQHAVPWHHSDALFHKDISFFVDVYPFYVDVVGLLSRALVYGVCIAVLAGYLYGAWRLKGGRQKISRGITVLISALLAGYLVVKAVWYWLSRYALTTSSQGPVTGPSYTSIHAGLPSKYVLMAIALLCAAALVANAALVRRVRMIAGTVVVMLVVGGVAGTAWPMLVYRLREAPSAAKVDLSEIAHNQKATLAAYGLNGQIQTVPYHPPKTMNSTALVRLAGSTAQIPLIDPNQLSPSFNVNQQLQAYYSFKSTLDIGHYNIDGKVQDVAIAVRGLNLSGIPGSSWVNNHLVYTHGYGVVAAPTTKMDPQTESPAFLDGGMPPGQQIPLTRPQVYFGLGMGSSYAIVGQPAGSQENLEFDHPGAGGSAKSAHTTYHGGGGIPLGSTMSRFLFAVRMHSSNILFSSELNRASQLLMVRGPAARVAKVAPWLTLDGDTYPVVVNGRIDWVVDGYTTASTYPDSQLINLHKATTTTLTADGASVSQPSEQVNYMHNSVKAVVDAYTGKVTLYAWNQKRQPDPLLQAWESVFPGLVKPQSSIPAALLPHLRYPTDLFNVQRYLLAKYHVAQPVDFYSGNDFWKVPADPTVAASKTLNSGSSATTTSAAVAASPSQPSQYISMSADGFGAQRYSLSSPMVTLNGRELASFIYVDSQPGPDYGKFTVLDFPAAEGGQSPLEVQNDIESDTKITEALTLQRGGDSQVVLGDLEAIPLAGRMLYVEPIYTQSGGSNSYPILRHVIVLYANGNPSFDNTLTPALKDAIASASGQAASSRAAAGK